MVQVKANKLKSVSVEMRPTKPEKIHKVHKHISRFHFHSCQVELNQSLVPFFALGKPFF